MKLKIPIPDFSGSEISSSIIKEKKKSKTKSKINTSEQEEAIVEVLSMFSKIKLGRTDIHKVIMPLLVFLVGISVFGNVTSSLNTSVVGPSVSGMIGMIPIILVGTTILGLFGLYLAGDKYDI